MNIEEALSILKNAGYKYTDKREVILTYFLKEDRYRTAKDLLNYMKSHFSGISLDTIYRNLNLFHELGILECTELAGEKHYQISCADHHHHHFICRKCGVTQEIKCCPMNHLSKELDNFIIEDHKFEVYGLCPVCH
ncbi:transcriptional repressor [Amphibacillus sp. MSJ-3]|uniref:Fur family transcriptional regulator n=1 Tax=Amphibacillus sp. MSJ-3 TaxID=2841505 RepID=UPI001C0E937D|nr:Fur family transcriptional regulator [Amphibacillus sp. MSJ-3]MBU5594029.1 transcriptional repressor [Amphibacillus sp. MSJ-3]